MSKPQHEGHLGAVYSAKQPEEIAALYDGWADSYDADMSAAGYRHPSICTALLCRHLPRGAEPILDAGAGTGLMGQWLEILGYPHVEALDISKGMLAVARQKGVYKAFHQHALGGNLPFADDSFAAVISAGVFTTGHVGSKGIDGLIRICNPGGVIVLTVKGSLWESEFADHVETLEREKLATLEELTPLYVSMPDEEGTRPSRGVVLKIL